MIYLYTFPYEQSARWVNGAEIARWIASARTRPRAIRSTVNACAREAGLACTAIRSVFPTGMGRIVPRNAVVKTVVGAIIFLASVTVLPVTPGRCEYFFSLFPTVKLCFNFLTFIGSLIYSRNHICLTFFFRIS